MNREEVVSVVNNVNNHSFPLFGLLGVVFVLCKIFGVPPIVAWSWWLVILPFFIPLIFIIAFVLVLLIGAGVVLGIAALLDVYSNWRSAKRRAKEHKRIQEARKNW